MRTSTDIRWKPVRKSLRWVRHHLRGWHANFATRISSVADSDLASWVIVSEFETRIRNRPELGEQNKCRIDNMRIACKAIHGLCLEPGQIFSLEHVIGEPSLEQGYRPGPIIFEGRLMSSVGGGLCQISTTLFNAALLANLTVLEKHNHSADIWNDQRMVDLGKDAVFVYLRKDLVFMNSLKAPVVVHLEILEGDSALRGRVWSPEPLAAAVTIRHHTLREHPMWVIKTERILLRDGVSQVNFERIDRYAKSGSHHRDRARNA